MCIDFYKCFVFKMCYLHLPLRNKWEKSHILAHVLYASLNLIFRPFWRVIFLVYIYSTFLRFSIEPFFFNLIYFYIYFRLSSVCFWVLHIFSHMCFATRVSLTLNWDKKWITFPFPFFTYVLIKNNQQIFKIRAPLTTFKIWMWWIWK